MVPKLSLVDPNTEQNKYVGAQELCPQGNKDVDIKDRSGEILEVEVGI